MAEWVDTHMEDVVIHKCLLGLIFQGNWVSGGWGQTLFSGAQ